MKTVGSVIRSSGFPYTILAPDADEEISFVYWAKCAIKDIDPVPASQLTCEICRQSAFVKVLDPNHGGVGVFCSECSKMGLYEKPRSQKKELCLPGLPKHLHSATFSTMDQKAPMNVSTFKAFAENPEGFLILGGSPGIGKTFVGAAIMHSVASRGMQTRYYECMDLYQKWMECASRYLGLLEMLQNVRFLFLDDFGHKNTSESYNEFLHLLFSRRKEGKGTVITTNYSPKELSINVSTPVFSRISSGISIQMQGKDRRKKN